MNSDFDVVIIGAGPAGSFAAERLAQAGVRAGLFDGRREGEPKACGGGVTSKALKAWPHLLDAVGRTVNELDLYAPSGKKLHLKLEEPFAIYSRIAFDSYLRNRAEGAGAKVIKSKVSARRVSHNEGHWCVKDSDGKIWTSKFLVAADGANSGIAKKLAGPLAAADMEVAFGYRAPLPSNDNAPTVVAFLPGWIGYAWAFPRLDHISFGIATTEDAFDHKELDKLMWQFMQGYYEQRQNVNKPIWSISPINSDLAATAERYAAKIPGLSVETWDKRRASGQDWALLGDAAGFADPVTGEGIYYALRSAELFADAFIEGHPEKYEARWRQDFGGELRRASQMRRRFYGNFWGAPFTERMIEFARGHRGIKKVLGELIAGDQGYVDLKKKLARNALKPI